MIDVNSFAHLNSDSEMIQAAVDKAAEEGESVIVPKYNKRTGSPVWTITQSIVLHNESVLILQNAHMVLGDGAICNMITNDIARTKDAYDDNKTQHGVSIIGIGNTVLDGGNHNGLYEANGVSRSTSKYPEHSPDENCMIFLSNINNLRISGITIKNQRYWGICLYFVSQSHVNDIHFESDSNVPNQDGIDLLKGCHDVVIENVFGCVGDNVVALLATEDNIYQKMDIPIRKKDIHNITIKNVNAHSVGGCSIIRLLNHDGIKLYNVRIDGLIECSPWSEDDAPVAQNPDLVIKLDENGDVIPYKKIIPGEIGYRCEAAIIIGEAYWYEKSKAMPGDTFGISVSNVMTHARYALFLNNTLQDAVFSNIRIFGNGFMGAYFGNGSFERIRFDGITYDKDVKPHKEDDHVLIEWNHTESKGLSCFYFNNAIVDKLKFENITCAGNMESIFGGFGEGEIEYKNIDTGNIDIFSTMSGITVKNQS